MELHPGGLVMIITPEQAALKAQERFGHLLDLVRQASQDGQRIDTVERDLMRHLLALGHDLLTTFVAHQGDGDQGPEVEADEGRIVRRLAQRHDRRYVSIFGELTITRVVYGTREGQKIESVPLDRRLGLPEGGLLLCPGGLVAAVLPEGVVRRGGPLAGGVAGPATGPTDLGADEPGCGRIRPGVPGGDRAAVARAGGAAAGRDRRWQGGPDAEARAGRPSTAPPPGQGREGEQEGDGLRR